MVDAQLMDSLGNNVLHSRQVPQKSRSSSRIDMLRANILKKKLVKRGPVFVCGCRTKLQTGSFDQRH